MAKIAIKTKIVSYEVSKANNEKPELKVVNEADTALVPDEPVEQFDMEIDPTVIVLDSAPSGFLDNVIRLRTPYVNGPVKRSLYMHVGFEQRKAYRNGDEFTILHPVELFLRGDGLTGTEVQMIFGSELLRSAKSPAKMASDFLKRKSTESIFVKAPNGKQKMVTCLDEVIGLTLKWILERAGVIDEYGQDVSYDKRPRMNGGAFVSQVETKPIEVVKTEGKSDYPDYAKECSACGEKAVIPKDGCDTCIACFDSKCQ